MSLGSSNNDDPRQPAARSKRSRSFFGWHASCANDQSAFTHVCWRSRALGHVPSANLPPEPSSHFLLPDLQVFYLSRLPNFANAQGRGVRARTRACVRACVCMVHLYVNDERKKAKTKGTRISKLKQRLARRTDREFASPASWRHYTYIYRNIYIYKYKYIHLYDSLYALYPPNDNT